MQIVHFIYDHPDNPWLAGGGAVRAWEINRRLVAMGHQVHMICGGFKHSPISAESEGIVYHFTGRASSYLVSRGLFTIGARKVFREVCSSFLVQIVIDDTSAFSYAMPWRVWNGPMVAVVHHIVGQFHARKKFGFAGNLIATFERLNLCHHRQFISVSSSTLQALVELGIPANSIKIIHNGIAPANENASLPVSIDYPFLLYLGRLEIYNKGLDRVLNLFSNAAKDKNLHLVVAGTGKDKDALSQMIYKHEARDRIHILGKVTDEVKHALLRNAQVVLMPSRYEGWGIVAIEAASQGTPVLGMRIPGLQEAVEDGVTGLLVDSESELAEGLMKILSDSSIRHRCENRAGFYRLNFSWDKVAQEQEQFLFSFI